MIYYKIRWINIIKKIKYLDILKSINKIYSSTTNKVANSERKDIDRNIEIENDYKGNHDRNLINNIDNLSSNLGFNSKIEDEIDYTSKVKSNSSKTPIDDQSIKIQNQNQNQHLFNDIYSLIDETKKSINFIKQKNVIGNLERNLLNKSIKKFETFEKFCKRKDVQKIKDEFNRLKLNNSLLNDEKHIDKNQNSDIVNKYLKSFNKNENKPNTFFSTEIESCIPKAGKILNVLNNSDDEAEIKNLTQNVSEYKSLKIKNKMDREKRLELSKSPHKITKFFYQKQFDETVNELYFNEEIIPEKSTPYDRIDIKEFIRISDKILKKKFKTSKVFNKKMEFKNKETLNSVKDEKFHNEKTNHLKKVK